MNFTKQNFNWFIFVPNVFKNFLSICFKPSSFIGVSCYTALNRNLVTNETNMRFWKVWFWSLQNCIFFDSFSVMLHLIRSILQLTWFFKKILSLIFFNKILSDSFLYPERFSNHFYTSMLWSAIIRGTFQVQVTTSQVAL